jgi:hypothetical protein
VRYFLTRPDNTDFAKQDTNGFYMLQRVSYAEFMFESQSIKDQRDLNCGSRVNVNPIYEMVSILHSLFGSLHRMDCYQQI